MSEALPTGFKDLKVAELRRTAVEDFAVAVDARDGKESVLAALVEAGVEWSDYIVQHPEVAPVAATPVPEVPASAPESPIGRETEKNRPGVVTTPQPVSNTALTVDNNAPVAVNPNQRFIQNADGTFSPVDDEVVPEAVAPVVHTYERPVYDPNDKLLIKMDRENPRFDVRGYTFTSEAPYALMKPEDAQYLMDREDGFRQAYPRELQEFYG